MLETEQGANSADNSTNEQTAADTSASEAAPKRRRTTTRKKAAAAAPVAEATPEAPAEQPAPAKKTTRRRTTKKAVAVEADVPLVELPAEVPAQAPAEKPARRTRTRKAPAKMEAAPEPQAVQETPAEPEVAASRTRKSTPAVTFQQPSLLFQPPELPELPEPDAEVAPVAAKAPAKTTRAPRKTAAAKAAEKAPEPVAEVAEEVEDTETDEGTSRRRRRRGGRRRGGRTGEDDAEGTETTEEPAAEAPAEAEAEGDSDEGEDGEGTGSRRRRRRRRRKGEPVDGAPDDPEVTVVKVREPRKSDTSEVTSVEGSTRLEAKKQRRREGREAGRRRPPILSESEFLARRESVDRTMVIRQHNDRTQIAVLEDEVLVEHYVAKEAQTSLIGNVYLGRVQNVLPSMEAAFIDIGRGRNAVLYAGEVDWDGLGHSGQPKRIEMALKSGQQVLVQVTKDPVGHKGARLTSQISLPGRYLVYVPHGSMNGISRKLPDTERNRLKALLKEIVPDEAGVVVRTAAEGASEDELSRDVARLTAQWEAIDKKVGNGGNAPELLYAEPDLLIKVVRDLFTEDFTKLVVVGDDAWDMVEGYVSHVAPHLADRLERWNSPDDAFATFRIDEQIIKALDRKVWLPSGGSLVIDRTEAMTVVDVNTGKFTGAGGNLEETVTKNNLEAAEEIVRQLRLRDIGGIIVVDFIDMVLESNRDLVLRRLVECLGRDRTKHQVAEVTSLGLVQMTRKRIGTGLVEAFSEPCDVCNGRGIKVHLDVAASSNSHSSSASSSDEEGGGGRRSRRRRRGGGGNVQPAAETETETEETTDVVEPVEEPDVAEDAEDAELPTPRAEDDAGSVDAVEPDVEPVPTRSRRRSRKRVAAAK